MFSVVQDVIRSPSWRDAFAGFEPPWHFYGVEDYWTWLLGREGCRGDAGEMQGGVVDR
jgi:hypothetical protein